jgi:gliding motility-associated-like protein
MLVASGTCPNATWTGPGVTGSTSDTVWANQPGSYSIGCTVTNTFGCSATASAGVSVQVKPQPQISIIPSGGVICPNDSVQLLCIGTGTFQWQGPGGPTGGNTNTIYVNQPGIYYCILTDTDFCALVSNTVLVLQYSTPYLTPPTDTICQGDSVVISVVAGGGSTILWQPPLSGNSPTQTVTAAGTYTCHIISCGITTIASVTVYVAVPLSQITASGDSIFCAGDSVILSANANMASYVWNPGAVIGQYLTVYQTGSYTLTTTNSFGCSATSAISLFSYTGNAVVPVATDTTVCKGHVVTLHASGSNIVWYSSPSSGNILFHGNSYTPPPLTANTVYYIASTDSVCKSTFVPLNVKVENCEDSIPNVFTPNGDGLNDSFIFPPLYTKCFHVKIYNRWGNLIYEGSDPLKGWDGRVTPSGKPASDGVYYYILKYCDPDLTEHATHGYIELIRG